jgi:hypothetical protein
MYKMGDIIKDKIEYILNFSKKNAFNNTNLKEEIKKKILEIFSFKRAKNSNIIDNIKNIINDKINSNIKLQYNHNSNALFLDNIKNIINDKINSNIKLLSNNDTKHDLEFNDNTKNELELNDNIKNELELNDNTKNELELNDNIKNELELNDNTKNELELNDNTKNELELNDNIKNELELNDNTNESLLSSYIPNKPIEEKKDTINSNKKEDINIIYKEASTKNPTNFYLISSLKTKQEYKNIRDIHESPFNTVIIEEINKKDNIELDCKNTYLSMNEYQDNIDCVSNNILDLYVEIKEKVENMIKNEHIVKILNLFKKLSKNWNNKDIKLNLEEIEKSESLFHDFIDYLKDKKYDFSGKERIDVYVKNFLDDYSNKKIGGKIDNILDKKLKSKIVDFLNQKGDFKKKVIKSILKKKNEKKNVSFVLPNKRENDLKLKENTQLNSHRSNSKNIRELYITKDTDSLPTILPIKNNNFNEKNDVNTKELFTNEDDKNDFFFFVQIYKLNKTINILDKNSVNNLIKIITFILSNIKIPSVSNDTEVE